MRHIKRLLAVDFVRFCIVGTAGFLINLGLLNLFYKQLGWPIFLTQLLASEVALFHNFSMHHNWTYKKRRSEVKSVERYIIEFHMTSWVAILGSALIVSLFVQVLHFNTLLALAASSVVALVWNFVWTRYYIWNEQSE